MSEQAGDKVTFIAVPGAYKTGENVFVKYEVDLNFETNPRDWVGVFCVGWSSNRDYYTFDWVQNEKANTEEPKSVFQVKFSGSRLPPEDGHFYQFCYVTRNGVVKGASRPFQFTKTLTGDCISDLDDLVEVNEEDSLLFLRTRHEAQLQELQKKVEQLTTVNENAEATMVTVTSDRDELKEKTDALIAELEACKLENVTLKDAMSAKDDQLQKLKNKLEANEEQFEASQKEVGLLQVTIVAKEEEAQVTKKLVNDLTRRVDAQSIVVAQLEKEKAQQLQQVQELGEQITISVDENKRLQENECALRDKCNQLEQENRELLEKEEIMGNRLKYKETEAAEMDTRVETLKAQIISLEEEMNDMAAEMEKEREEKRQLMETARIKEQEANVAQENLCEVLGNVKEPRDLLDHQQSVENVDRSALEALQLAYNDVEKRLNYERKSAIRLRNKVAEMEERIKECRREFETVAAENCDLKKEVKRCRTPSIGTEKSTAGSEATIQLLQHEYQRLELELQEFQLKHDQRMDEKNARINQLEKDLDAKVQEVDGRRFQEQTMRKTIDSLQAEKDQLSAANLDLNQKLEKEKTKNRRRDVMVTPPSYNPGYPPNAPVYPPIGPRYQPNPNAPPHRPNTVGKECPICRAMFPRRMNQQDFERHVNSHF